MRLELVTGSASRDVVKDAVDLEQVATALGCDLSAIELVCYGVVDSKTHFSAHLEGMAAMINNTGVINLARYLRELSESIGFTQGGVTVTRT